MTVNRPAAPVSRAEEIALAESRDLPPRLDGADRRDPLAKRGDAERDLRPKGQKR